MFKDGSEQKPEKKPFPAPPLRYPRKFKGFVFICKVISITGDLNCVAVHDRNCVVSGELCLLSCIFRTPGRRLFELNLNEYLTFMVVIRNGFEHIYATY